MSKTVAIDVGVRGTGVALFTHDDIYPTHVVNIEPLSHMDEWGKRCNFICVELENFLSRHKPADCYMELPCFFPTKRGMMTARGGHLVKLSMLAGMIYKLVTDYGIEMYTVEPIEWKGNKDKAGGEKLVRRVLPDLNEKLPRRKKFSSHEIDAIGIGLYSKRIVERGYRKGGRV